MAVKYLRQRLVAFVAGLLLGPALVWAGLESGTYISDLVSTNPLGSDLASTLDDHIRLLKSTIKTTFPNINGAVTVTDEQLNAVATNVAANPTASIGLSAVNGSASTYLRSDGAPALSQAIAPTWTGKHIFSFSGGGSGAAINVSAAQSSISLNETDASTDNKLWDLSTTSEQLALRTVNDASAAVGNIMLVDRTGTTVDQVTFPRDASSIGGAFRVGTAGSLTGLAYIRSTAGNAAIIANSQTAPVVTLVVHHEATSGDNVFQSFVTESGGGSTRGSIDYNRAGGAVRYNTTSDERLKKNFKPAPSAKSVIDCIQIESFDWKERGHDHVDHGVVAQRLNKCAPYAVSRGDVWQVDKSSLIPVMIKYMQEQDARIARLEADAARRH